MSGWSEKLHQLRSALAAVQAESELLELDGINVRSLKAAITESLRRLTEAEEHDHDIAALLRWDRLVLLEDNEQVGSALVRRMMRQGFQACLVFSIPAALRWVAEDVALVADLSALEEATPVEMEALRQIRPIVLTGASHPDASRRAAPFAPRAILAKPLDVDRLVAILCDRPT